MKNKNYYINCAIVIAIMLAGWFIPPFGPVTEVGMKILFIFLGALYGWIRISLIWPSVAAFVFVGLSGYSTVPKVISSAGGNDIVLLILFLLLLAGILNQAGITKYIAQWMVTRKISNGRPWVLSFMILMASFWCSALVSGIAGSLICWEFVYSISEQVGYKKRDPWPAMMVAGVIFAACVGGAVMPFKQGVVATFGFLSAASGGTTSYDYMQYLIFGIIFGTVLMLLYLAGCKFILKPDLTKFLATDFSVGNVEKLNSKQKLAFRLLLVLVIALLLPSVLPDGFFLKTILQAIGTNATVLIVVAIGVFMRDKDGEHYYNFKDIAQAISWDLLFMVAAAMILGPALSAKETGISTLLVNGLSPIFGGHGIYLFSLIFLTIMLVGTNFINNAVMCAIFVPVMYGFATQMHANPIAITVLVCFASNIAILLPSASPLGAMINGNQEWISQADIVKTSVLGMVIAIIVIAAIGIPLANLIISG